ncbi:hypothetical protein C0J52_26382 [Blattella germanica]|nr:hypothetical protein C0J52_26382 [Blattella germanica]
MPVKYSRHDSLSPSMIKFSPKCTSVPLREQQVQLNQFHHLGHPNQQFMSWSEMVMVFLLCHWPKGLLEKGRDLHCRLW